MSMSPMINSISPVPNIVHSSLTEGDEHHRRVSSPERHRSVTHSKASAFCDRGAIEGTMAYGAGRIASVGRPRRCVSRRSGRWSEKGDLRAQELASSPQIDGVLGTIAESPQSQSATPLWGHHERHGAERLWRHAIVNSASVMDAKIVVELPPASVGRDWLEGLSDRLHSQMVRKPVSAVPPGGGDERQLR